MRGLADVGYIIATLMGLVVVIGVSWIVLTSVHNAFESVGQHEAAKGIAHGKEAISAFGNVVAFVIFIMGLAAIVLAYFVRSHPVFFPISLTIGAIFIILAAIFANFSESFITQVNDVTGDFTVTFEAMTWLAIHQPLWVAILVVAIVAFTYLGKSIMEVSS